MTNRLQAAGPMIAIIMARPQARPEPAFFTRIAIGARHGFETWVTDARRVIASRRRRYSLRWPTGALQMLRDVESSNRSVETAHEAPPRNSRYSGAPYPFWRIFRQPSECAACRNFPAEGCQVLSDITGVQIFTRCTPTSARHALRVMAFSAGIPVETRWLSAPWWVSLPKSVAFELAVVVVCRIFCQM